MSREQRLTDEFKEWHRRVQRVAISKSLGLVLYPHTFCLAINARAKDMWELLAFADMVTEFVSKDLVSSVVGRPPRDCSFPASTLSYLGSLTVVFLRVRAPAATAPCSSSFIRFSMCRDTHFCSCSENSFMYSSHWNQLAAAKPWSDSRKGLQLFRYIKCRTSLNECLNSLANKASSSCTCVFSFASTWDVLSGSCSPFPSSRLFSISEGCVESISEGCAAGPPNLSSSFCILSSTDLRALEEMLTHLGLSSVMNVSTISRASAIVGFF
mmetsp:Transcript_28531/g.39728  ORF Transcript_28531/g.39728 Transcript_28531/m.39728 type:complete len:269 (+) Transcript_28531:173-979(+)